MEGQSRRLLFLLVGLASIFVIIWGIQSSAYILNPILLALVITITVMPLPARLTKRGLPSWLALVLTILLVVGILAFIIMLIVLSISNISDQLPSTLSTSPPDQATTTSLPYSMDQVVQLIEQAMHSSQVKDVLFQIVTAISQGVFILGMVMIIFIFMLSAAITLPSVSRLGLNPESQIVIRVATLTNDVRKYMSVMTLINFLVGLGDTIFLMILGVDYAVLWGVLAWMMGYIPSVGFIIALIPPLVLAYVEFGLSTAIIVLVGYILINGSIQNFLQPKVMGTRLHISPVVVFVSVFIWAWLLGGIGAILAVPLTLIILSTLESFEPTRWVSTLLRYTPAAEEKGEQEAALGQAKKVWDKVRDLVKM